MALLIILHHIVDPNGRENETSGQPFATEISLATTQSQRSINLNQSSHLCIRLDRGDMKAQVSFKNKKEKLSRKI